MGNGAGSQQQVKKVEFRMSGLGANVLGAAFAIVESQLPMLAANAGGPHVVTCRFIIVSAWTVLKVACAQWLAK